MGGGGSEPESHPALGLLKKCYILSHCYRLVNQNDWFWWHVCSKPGVCSLKLGGDVQRGQWLTHLTLRSRVRRRPSALLQPFLISPMLFSQSGPTGKAVVCPTGVPWPSTAVHFTPRLVCLSAVTTSSICKKQIKLAGCQTDFNMKFITSVQIQAQQSPKRTTIH